MVFSSHGIRGDILFDEPLSRHTSLKVGGPADVFISPADTNDLLVILERLREQDIPFFIIGGGYNLLVRDGGFRGAVVSLRNLQAVVTDGNLIHVEAGLSNHKLVDAAVSAGLGGLEFLAGIPGTVGGALAMNAGAHGSAIGDLVGSMKLAFPEGACDMSREELSFSYRHFDMPDQAVIIGATMKLQPADREEMKARIHEYREHRRTSQNVGFPSAGSFFKNPSQAPAWRLVDEAGFRGAQVGGAQVSRNHCNFFVNVGGAKAADFLQLAASVKKEVLRRTGIILEEEVKILGEDQ